jgi:hypothetical protein
MAKQFVQIALLLLMIGCVYAAPLSCDSNAAICSTACESLFQVNATIYHDWTYDGGIPACIAPANYSNPLEYVSPNATCDTFYSSVGLSTPHSGECSEYDLIRGSSIVCPSYTRMGREVNYSDCICYPDPDMYGNVSCVRDDNITSYFNFEDIFYTGPTTIPTTTTTLNEAAYLPPIHLINGKAVPPTTIPTQQLQTQNFLEGVLQWIKDLFK